MHDFGAVAGVAGDDLKKVRQSIQYVAEHSEQHLIVTSVDCGGGAEGK
ncbi:MAG: hypothetical protein IJC36_01780 [Clostridia bacterium]|nr:hypothetical protein [Clostridia bacterium]